MRSKSFAHKVISYGPGGYRCPCCGPNPKHRDEERRFEQLAVNRLINKIEQQHQDDIDGINTPDRWHNSLYGPEDYNLWAEADEWWDWYQRRVKK